MNEITIERSPTKSRLDELGVLQWPIWTKEVSCFHWHYDDTETCYFLEGEVIVTPDGGEPVRMGKGDDLVTFPRGMTYEWDIRGDAKKHYKFG